MTVKIIYADETLVVVEKPSGLLSVPGRGEHLQTCVVTELKQHYPDVLTVHRLDQATSGLMVFARNLVTQRALNYFFRERLVNKQYVAIVHGQLQPRLGTINFPLIADWPNRPKQKVDVAQGKPCLTHYCVLGVTSQPSYTTRVLLHPITGRSHQLRVHLQALGYPILGDKLYAPAAIAEQAERLLLHASYLQFPHPMTQEKLTWVSHVPF